MSKGVLVISPSGNLYGSEQVLCDYLSGSRILFEVAVPAGSKLEARLKGSRHKVVTFSNVKVLYAKVFFRLLNGEFSSVYVNEGGHSRYVQLLARFFPQVRFIVHVRIIEDTEPSRWGSIRKENTLLVSISDYLKQRLRFESILVNDLFPFPEEMPTRGRTVHSPLQIALIGRLTHTKGFKELVCVAESLEKDGRDNDLHLNIYGDVMKDVAADPSFRKLQHKDFIQFHGFVPGELIYADNDLVLHLSKVEPLGRIFFEAVAHGIPLVGFMSGGIGEIAAKVGLEGLLVEPGQNEAAAILEKISEISARSHDVEQMLNHALIRMKEIYCADVYTRSMDSIIMGEDLG